MWPARAYVTGTWGYAFYLMTLLQVNYRQKMFIFQSVLDGDKVWVLAWDPKRENRDGRATPRDGDQQVGLPGSPSGLLP